MDSKVGFYNLEQKVLIYLLALIVQWHLNQPYQKTPTFVWIIGVFKLYD